MADPRLFLFPGVFWRVKNPDRIRMSDIADHGTDRETSEELAYYQRLPYRLEIIPDAEEGGYAARYPQLKGCITCGDTLEETQRNARDAKTA